MSYKVWNSDEMFLYWVLCRILAFVSQKEVGEISVQQTFLYATFFACVFSAVGNLFYLWWSSNTVHDVRFMGIQGMGKQYGRFAWWHPWLIFIVFALLSV